jgi:hypothetical protein
VERISKEGEGSRKRPAVSPRSSKNCTSFSPRFFSILRNCPAVGREDTEDDVPNGPKKSDEVRGKS